MTGSLQRKGDTVGKAGKIIAGLVTVALVTGGAAAGLSYIKKKNVRQASVVQVSSLSDSYYYDETSLYGTITSNVTQQISVDKDVIIDEVYVKKGDSVKKGDRLIHFDTTLVEMELNIARLKRQKLEQDLNSAASKVQRIQNGESISDSEIFGSSSVTTDEPVYDDSSFDMISRRGEEGVYTALAFPKVLLAEVLDDGGGFTVDDYGADTDPAVSFENEETSAPSYSTGESTVSGDALSSGDELSSGPEWSQYETIVEGQDPSGSVPLNPSVTPEATPVPTTIDLADLGGLTDGDEEFYLELNYQSRPFTGSGTQEDPFVFLCSQARGEVRVLGSFFNKMAGRSEDGSQILKSGGYWFVLEFYPQDSIEDYQDRKASCLGYYYINGGLFTEPLNPFAETTFTVADAQIYEEILPTGSAGYSGGYTYTGSSSGSSMSSKEILKILQMRVSSLELDMKESDIKISKLEKKCAVTDVDCRIEGIVEFVGDPSTGTSADSAFMKIRSADGFYLRGEVGELMLDKLAPGTVLNCTSYMIGNFQASVVDISTYPTESSDGMMDYSGNNPNVSKYSFTAEIEDQSLPFSDQDWVTVSIDQESDYQGSLILSKAFVRSEDGAYYVMKEEDGVLKKQYVKSGGTVNGGYSIRITAGLSLKDKIAFPYGDAAAEGTPTKDGTLDQLYGY